MGENKLRHFKCSNGAEFVISPDAEKVALESSPWLRGHIFENAKHSDDQVILIITLPENRPPGPAPGLILQFKPRSELRT